MIFIEFSTPLLDLVIVFCHLDYCAGSPHPLLPTLDTLKSILYAGVRHNLKKKKHESDHVNPLKVSVAVFIIAKLKTTQMFINQ